MNNRKLPISVLTLESRDDYSYHDPQANRLINFLTSRPETCLLDKCLKDIYRYPTFYGLSYLDEGVRVIKGESIIEGELADNGEMDFISDEDAARFPRTILKEGDLVMGVRGTVGKVAVVPLKFVGSIINANLIRMQLKENVDPYYLHAYLSSRIGQTLIERQSTKAIQSTITVPYIKAIPVWLPSKEIQQSIARMLQEAYRERAQILKQVQAEAHFDEEILPRLQVRLDVEAFPKRFVLNTSDFINGRDDYRYYSPEFKAVLNALVNRRNTNTVDKIVSSITNGVDCRDYQEYGVPYIRVAQIKNGMVDLSNVALVSEESLTSLRVVPIQTNDVLFTRKGSPGNTAVVDDTSSHCVISSEIMRIRLKEGVLPSYFAAFCHCTLGRIQIERGLTGSLNYGINQRELRRVIAPIPSTNVQEEIANAVVAKQAKLLELEKKANNLVSEAKRAIEYRILDGNFTFDKEVDTCRVEERKEI